MNQLSIEKIVDYVENFDDKNIRFAQLICIFSSGVYLLHSMLDNHPQVIIIPSAHYFYREWIAIERYKDNYNNLIDNFFQTNFGMGYTNQLGCNKDISIDIKSPVENILRQVLPKLSSITRKKFLLSLNFAYAAAFNIDISKIKLIISHYHDTPSRYLLKLMKEDFPQSKFIYSMRNPFEMFYSRICSESRDMNAYVYSIAEASKCFYNFLKGKDYIKNDLKVIKFEDVHLKTEDTMRNLADFLGIDFDKTLLESTFLGELWYVGSNTGPNSQKDINGWKKNIDNNSKVLFATIFNPAAERFGYETCDDSEKYNFNVLFKGEFSALIRHLKQAIKDKQSRRDNIAENIYLELNLSPKVTKLSLLFFNIVSIPIDVFSYFIKYFKLRQQLFRKAKLYSERIKNL